MEKNSKKAFTLAEVLITLGIIGVVAAMTIPTLSSNVNGSRFRAQFKKSLSTLAQAGKMSQANNDFSFSDVNADCGSTPANDDPNVVMSNCAIMNGSLTGYSVDQLSNIKLPSSSTAYSYTKTKTGNFNWTSVSSFVAYTLADGSLVGVPKQHAACNKEYGSPSLQCFGFIDVNGPALPNKEVSCKTASHNGDVGSGSKDCIVDNANMGDIFPIWFTDSTVEPATVAAAYVLKNAK